jgi:iron complex outermembrane receptor protein
MSGTSKSLRLRAAVLSALAIPAMAAAEETERAGVAALEEITVTAQKRDESSQDVPISIQAISADMVVKLGATQVADLAQSAPSLSIGGVPGSQQQMGLRGVVDYSRNIGIDARMGVYIDGVYQGRSSTASQPLLGLQSVEILRGPQGTLFGMNTVSGAINLNTRPASDEFSGQLSAGAGNEGYWTGSVYLNGPISDKVFGSVAYTRQERDGWYTNPNANGKVGDWQQDGVRGQLRWLATDSLEVTLAGDYGKTQSEGPLYTKASDPAYYTEKGPELDEVEFWGAALTVDYTFAGDYTLTSISAYRDNQYLAQVDEDFSALVEAFQTSFDEGGDQFSQELRLVSPMNDRYDWVAGLYYFDGSISTGRNIYLAPPILPSAALSGRVAVPSQVDTTSYAAYVHGNFRLTDRLELTAGLRYTNIEKKLDFTQVSTPDNETAAYNVLLALGYPPAVASVLAPQVPGVLLAAPNLTYQDKYSDDAVTPMLGLNFRLSEDVLLYAKYSNGFQSGGFNADFAPPLPPGDWIPFESETVDAYEVGLKSTLAGGTLRLNIDAFTQKYKDFQVFQRVLYGNTSVQIVSNAGEATSQGVEGEITWLPIDRLQLTFNGTWLDAAYDKFENPVPQPGEPDDFNGNKLNFAPEWKMFAGVQYVQPLGGVGDLTFNVDYSYQTKMYSDPRNREQFDLIPSYDLWNARVTYTAASQRWNVSAWARNLTDEEYIVNHSRASITNIDRVIWGTPRLYGLSFTYNLGL